METPVRILMNEDDPEQIVLNEHELRHKGIVFTAKQVSTREEFLAALDSFKPDIVLSDYSLPTFDALSVLRLVKERKLSVPVIVVTGSINEETAIDTIMAGASDYVLKQRLQKLPAAVEGALERAKVFIEKAHMEEALKRREFEFRTLVENSPDIIARYDSSLRYTYVNPVIEQITGIPRSNFIGKTNRQLGMDEDTASYLESMLQKAFSTGREVTDEYALPGPFGKRYFLIRVVPEYFTKEGKPESMMSISRDITLRKTAEEHIKYVSFHDEHTGLYNRMYFEEELNRLDRGRELPISVIMGDINFLKLANDMFGHAAGDQLLVMIAAALKSVARAGDVISRWGGDEFTLLLPRTDYDAARKLADRITGACAETRVDLLPASIALGVATKVKDDDNIYHVLRNAEEAMYSTKMMESKENIRKMKTAILDRIAKQDKNAGAHCQRMENMIALLGEALGLAEDQRHELSALVSFHDLGKATVPGGILTGKGELSPDAWDVVKKVPELGYRIAKSLSEYASIPEAVLGLREHWDGQGYPRAAAGEDIPWLSRMFAVIDAYDVMTHERPYGPALSPREAVEELRRSAGKQFDPALVECFIAALARQPVAVP